MPEPAAKTTRKRKPRTAPPMTRAKPLEVPRVEPVPNMRSGPNVHVVFDPWAKSIEFVRQQNGETVLICLDDSIDRITNVAGRFRKKYLDLKFVTRQFEQDGKIVAGLWASATPDDTKAKGTEVTDPPVA